MATFFYLPFIFRRQIGEICLFFFCSNAKVCALCFISFWIWIATNFGFRFTLAMLVFEEGKWGGGEFFSSGRGSVARVSFT